MTASDFRVTLLGTGTPVPSPDRFGPCTLVEAGDQKFLIDAGRGATTHASLPIKLLRDREDVFTRWGLLDHQRPDHVAQS
jgi:ribonuclease BN (tRNA processing enzyme)